MGKFPFGCKGSGCCRFWRGRFWSCSGQFVSESCEQFVGLRGMGTETFPVKPERSWMSHEASLDGPKPTRSQLCRVIFGSWCWQIKGRKTAQTVGFVSLHTRTGLSWGTAAPWPKSNSVTASPSKSQLGLAQQGQPGGGSWPSPARG